MKGKAFRLSSLAADSACALLLSTALSLVALDTLGHSLSFLQCLILAALALLIVILLTRRWWVFPSFLLLCALALAALVFVFKLYDVIYGYAAGFYAWCRAAYPAAEPYSYNGSILLVRLFLVLPATAVSFLYFRRLFFFYLQPAVAAALLYWLWVYDRDKMAAVLVLLLVVIFASMGRYAGLRINRRHKRAGTGTTPPGMLQLHALIIGAFVILFAFAAAPKNDGDWRSRGLVNFVADIRDYYNYSRGRTSGFGSFSLAEAGYGGALGGDVELSNDVALKVNTKTPALLTGGIYDVYDGKSWSDSGDNGSFRFYSALWQGKKRQAYCLDKPLGGKEAFALYKKLTSRIELKITPYKSGRTLFYSGSVISVKTPQDAEIDAYFNLEGELYTGKTAWKANSSYVVASTVFDRSREGFDAAMLELEALAYKKEDRNLEAVRERYLQLPETLPAAVYDKAREITQGSSSPYLKAVALESWLSENSAYTLTPGDVPEGRDFVDYFLETGEGYCEYYASAMTVLARCAGLPARYVVGYGLKRDYEYSTDYYTATKATAHAWSEVYFSGIGWLTFDPSGWVFDEVVVLDEPEPETQAPLAEPPASLLPTPTPAPTPEQPAGAPESSARNGTTLLAVLIFITALFLIYVFVRYLLSFAGASNYYRRLCRRYKDREARLDAAYRRLIRQAAFLGVEMRDGDTISSFAARVDEKAGDRVMTRVCAPVILHRFALQDIRNDDVRSLCDRYAAVEKRLKRDLGFFRYVWRRFLLGR